MMTRSTFKTFWLTGGGALATWLAVNPNTTTPAIKDAAALGRGAAIHDVTSDELAHEESSLRRRSGNSLLAPSTRNPFQFGKPAARERTPQPVATPAALLQALAAPPRPSLSLSGIATDGAKRTAIISGDGQLYLVGEGEPVAGRYHVVTVDSDAVTLRSDDGEELRLVLR
jgi:hypothetical protein